MPYAKTSDPERKPTAPALEDAERRSKRWKVRWVKRFDDKRSLSDQGLVAIEKALASGHPVACGSRWPNTTRGHEMLEVPPPDEVRKGHSIVFTGYEGEPVSQGRDKKNGHSVPCP